METEPQPKKHPLEEVLPQRHVGMMKSVYNTFFTPHKPLGRHGKMARGKTQSRRKMRY